MKRVSFKRFPQLSYAGSEAMNTLCTNLAFSGANVKKVMITSSRASEGKSFISMNVMRTMTKHGKTVALVDADLRRSMIVSYYGATFDNDAQQQGLAHYLAGMATIDDVIYKTDIDGALFVPIGRELSNTMTLLNSPRMSKLLDYLAEMVDYVIVDAPPVGTVIDGALIAKYCDGTVLVVNYDAIHKQELIEVRDQIRQSGCPILGTVLNKVDLGNYMNKKYYYKSYHSAYDHYYGDAYTPSAKTKKKKK